MYQVKRIAVLTMVRNDDFFLRKWVEYYGRELGKENLYIYYDGEDQTIADFCQGTNAFLHPKIGTQVVAAEKARLKFLSERAAELVAKGYDLPRTVWLRIPRNAYWQPTNALWPRHHLAGPVR